MIAHKFPPSLNEETILIVLLLLICSAGFSQNLRFKQCGTPIPARTDLDVRWEATNSFPPQLWVYHLLPATFSSNTISTLMTIGSFTDKDRIDAATNEMRFRSSDNSRFLFISFSQGVLSYKVTTHYGPANLNVDVPDKGEVVRLTKELLPKLGIRLSDIDKGEDGSGPDFSVGDSVTEYYVHPITITNIEFRRVSFRRAVDGVSFLSARTGGNGDIRFGDHGKIIQIYLSWRNLERNKSYPTLTVKSIMQSIRNGKAIQGSVADDSPWIDWPTAKNITIKNARPCYYAGDPLQSSDWLYPFAALSTTVDTGRGNVDVEIDCPIIDESKAAGPQ